MKFSQLKQYLVERGVDDKQTVYYNVADGYVFYVWTKRDLYFLMPYGIILSRGGVVPGHPNDEIKFFWHDQGYCHIDCDNTFSGPVADDIEVNVNVYKRVDAD